MLCTLLQEVEVFNTHTSSGVLCVYIQLILSLPFHEENISVSWVCKVPTLFTAMFVPISMLYNPFPVFS